MGHMPKTQAHLQHLGAQKTHENRARAQPAYKRRPRYPLQILHGILPYILPFGTRTQPLVQAGPAGVPRGQQDHEDSNDEDRYTEEEERDKAQDIVDPLVLSDRGDNADRDADNLYRPLRARVRHNQQQTLCLQRCLEGGNVLI